MLATTATYKTKIKAASRDIKAKVEIYFDGELSAPITLTKVDIASIQGLEEIQAEGDTPLGAVSSNEFTLTLYNSSHRFTPTYTLSPYFGKLVPNVKVVPYLGLETSTGVYEWLKMGTFWTSNWDAPTDNIDATVVCYDRLYLISDKDVPIMPSFENITRYAMFENLFKAISLASDNYTIDIDLLNYTIPIGYYIDGKVGEALAKMAQAFNCTVFCTRDDKIKVLSNATVGGSVATWTDTDMLFSVTIPQDFDRIYSDVCVKYRELYVAAEESVLRMTDVVIPVAGVTLTNVKFNTSPVAFVSYIKITNSQHLTIGAMSIGTWGISMVITNISGANITVEIEIFGHPIKSLDGEVTIRDAVAYALLMNKERILPIDNYLVQSVASATIYANAVLPLIADPLAYVHARTRGDMSLEPGDVITVSDATNHIGATVIIPIRFDYRYDGALDCEILGMKTSARS